MLWVLRDIHSSSGKSPVSKMSLLGVSQQMDNEFICGEDDGCVRDLPN